MEVGKQGVESTGDIKSSQAVEVLAHLDSHIAKDHVPK